MINYQRCVTTYRYIETLNNQLFFTCFLNILNCDSKFSWMLRIKTFQTQKYLRNIVKSPIESDCFCFLIINYAIC
ncbi:unnamed protein product [Paramecium sonneborni]|uniref:Uncharacterized protein n=1 Tax=Paramecium sonneborni TaxID=65129 RepID=A0A8S1QPD5_9CILI|nr:unnamed protein product [Paramecium sonneborni]